MIYKALMAKEPSARTIIVLISHYKLLQVVKPTAKLIKYF